MHFLKGITMKNLFLALLVSALIPAVAFAGGGSKPTSTIRIKNLGGDLLAVIVDPPQGFNPTTLEAFRNAGGKTLNTGETTFFKVREGTHTVSGAFIVNAPGNTGNFNVTIGKGRTVDLNANQPAAFPGAPVFSVDND
jgi:hypothetical protein